MWVTRDRNNPQVRWGTQTNRYTNIKNVWLRCIDHYIIICVFVLVMQWSFRPLAAPMQQLTCVTAQPRTMDGLTLAWYTGWLWTSELVTRLNYWAMHFYCMYLVYSLAPGGKYYYRFGDNAYGWSDEFTFNAAPVPGPNVTTKVLAFGGRYIIIWLYMT